MKLVDADYKIMTFTPENDVRDICVGYTTCYESAMPETFEKQCEFIYKHRHHESQLEHSRLTVLFTINRGVSHEIVRHRHCSFGQQSTRYCNYSKDRFNNELTFIRDCSIVKDKESYKAWLHGREMNEKEYFAQLKAGYKPEQARGCLPNDLATKLLVTTNYREWRSIFKLRCDTPAHYQMREVMIPLFKEVRNILPCVFDDIHIKED